MAKGKKTGGRDFKKGEIPNPNGRPKVPEDVREAKKLTHNEVMLLLTRFLKMDFAELQKFIGAKVGRAEEMFVATVIFKGITKGDQYRLDFLFNRLIGKVTDKVQHTLPKPMVIERADGTQLIMGAEMPEEEKE